MPLQLFIIGPHASGKTEQAKLVAEKFNLALLSVSQILRDEVSVNTGFGLEVKRYLDQEVQVPDDLVFDILVDKLKAINFQNFVIDGFPRTLNQGRVIELYLKKQGQVLSLIIHLGSIEESTASLREHFKNKGKLIEVDGDSAFDVISTAITKINK